MAAHAPAEIPVMQWTLRSKNMTVPTASLSPGSESPAFPKARIPIFISTTATSALMTIRRMQAGFGIPPTGGVAFGTYMNPAAMQRIRQPMAPVERCLEPSPRAQPGRSTADTILPAMARSIPAIRPIMNSEPAVSPSACGPTSTRAPVPIRCCNTRAATVPVTPAMPLLRIQPPVRSTSAFVTPATPMRLRLRGLSPWTAGCTWWAWSTGAATRSDCTKTAAKLEPAPILPALARSMMLTVRCWPSPMAPPTRWMGCWMRSGFTQEFRPPTGLKPTITPKMIPPKTVAVRTMD